MTWATERKRRRGRPKTTWRQTAEKQREEAGWRSWNEGQQLIGKVEMLCESLKHHKAWRWVTGNKPKRLGTSALVYYILCVLKKRLCHSINHTVCQHLVITWQTIDKLEASRAVGPTKKVVEMCIFPLSCQYNSWVLLLILKTRFFLHRSFLGGHHRIWSRQTHHKHVPRF